MCHISSVLRDSRVSLYKSRTLLTGGPPYIQPCEACPYDSGSTIQAEDHSWCAWELPPPSPSAFHSIKMDDIIINYFIL